MSCSVRVPSMTPPRVRLGILGPCGLAPERRVARKRLHSNRWARRMEILRGCVGDGVCLMSL